MRTPRGLTLIELMATVAITGVLVAAALGVAARLSRAEAISERSHGASLSEARLEDLLALDVVHAMQYRNTSEGVELRLRARLDAGTLELEHLRSTACYRLRRIAGRRWLVRVQKTPARRDIIELVLPGIHAVSLAPAGGGTERSEEWQVMPEVAVLTIGFEEAGRRSAEMRFRTR